MVKVEGKADRAARCECRMQNRNSVLLRNARIPERYNGGFPSFMANFPGAHQSIAVAKMAAERMAGEYPVSRGGLLFIGPVGVGKTHLACAVLTEIIKKGIPGLFYSYADLLAEIRNTYNEGGGNRYVNDGEGGQYQTESEILRHVTGVDILLLDELGKVKATDWVLDKIREIIGRRYDKERTTLVTTNYMLDGKVNLGEKIGVDMVSRLTQMCRIFQMDGVDYRTRRRD